MHAYCQMDVNKLKTIFDMLDVIEKKKLARLDNSVLADVAKSYNVDLKYLVSTLVLLDALRVHQEHISVQTLKKISVKRKIQSWEFHIQLTEGPQKVIKHDYKI